MAGVLLQVLTDKPGASLVTLLDAEPSTTGYTLRGNVDLGNATWNKVYSGQRGTQGATLAGAEPQARRAPGLAHDGRMTALPVVCVPLVTAWCCRMATVPSESTRRLQAIELAPVSAC